MGVLGQRIRRVEDRSLLTGEARYTADITPEGGVLDVCFVRSGRSHAVVRGVDVSVAAAMPGVVAVCTAADLAPLAGESAIPVPPELVRPLLAADHVRFAGEILAAVVADSRAHADDAAEHVVVDEEPLPVVAGIDDALAPDAALLFPSMGTNAVLTAEATPAGAAGDLVVEVTFGEQRVAIAPIEPDAILVEPGDGERFDLVVHVATQAPHLVRDAIAASCSLAPERVRVIGPWVGGGFGGKSMAITEHLVVARLVQRLGRALRWTQSRRENLADVHGRAQRQRVRVAADADGHLRSLHADIVSDNGAYPGFNHFLAHLTVRMLAGTYALDAATGSITSVATNTAAPMGYRGAGRPEAACLVERAVDIVAAELGIDPLALRLQNVVSSDAFPHTTPTGAVYDSGDYARALRTAAARARYAERRFEQAERRAAGAMRLLGIGVSSYVEVTAGAGPTELGDVEVHRDGTVTVRVGTFGHGQGHRTTYAQIAADALGLPLEAIRVVDGDTAEVPRGYGTYGSRSMQVGGVSVHVAALEVVEQARALAAAHLEAAVADIVHDDDGFAVAGVPASRLTWAQLAALAPLRGDGSSSDGAALRATVDWERPASTFPFGAHVSVVEVDIETGEVRVLEHVAVDDCGTVLNPLLADGQVHGGIAQGIAQVLYEQVVHDDAANVVTSSFADYGIVSAAELPSYTRVSQETPTPLNPLGAKGIGESGTIGSTPAVHNAVVDALAHLGVRHIDMPCTPEKVWRAIQGERHAVTVTRHGVLA